jgi:hypothetical protein
MKLSEANILKANVIFTWAVDCMNGGNFRSMTNIKHLCLRSFHPLMDSRL